MQTNNSNYSIQKGKSEKSKIFHNAYALSFFARSLIKEDRKIYNKGKSSSISAVLKKNLMLVVLSIFIVISLYSFLLFYLKLEQFVVFITSFFLLTFIVTKINNETTFEGWAYFFANRKVNIETIMEKTRFDRKTIIFKLAAAFIQKDLIIFKPEYSLTLLEFQLPENEILELWEIKNSLKSPKLKFFSYAFTISLAAIPVILLLQDFYQKYYSELSQDLVLLGALLFFILVYFALILQIVAIIGHYLKKEKFNETNLMAWKEFLNRKEALTADFVNFPNAISFHKIYDFAKMYVENYNENYHQYLK
ncbi:MAG: hypothetical protein ACW981_05440 [Candidatus Hodarchaeales archaeon]|jgi:hypothetical protein